MACWWMRRRVVWIYRPSRAARRRWRSRRRGCNGLARRHACVRVYKSAVQSTSGALVGCLPSPSAPPRRPTSSATSPKPATPGSSGTPSPTSPQPPPPSWYLRSTPTYAWLTCIVQHACVSSVASLYPLDLSPHPTARNRALHFLR
jgi:hypothetical protein